MPDQGETSLFSFLFYPIGIFFFFVLAGFCRDFSVEKSETREGGC